MTDVMNIQVSSPFLEFKLFSGLPKVSVSTYRVLHYMCFFPDQPPKSDFSGPRSRFFQVQVHRFFFTPFAPDPFETLLLLALP